MISLVQLEYIIAVDIHRHFATAADHCFVTQPTLSMQIKKVEDYYEAKIFDRSKHPVVPTEFGKKFIVKAREIVRQAQQLDELAKGFQGKVEGELKIGIIPTVAPYLLHRFIGNYSKKYPDLSIKIQELQTHEIIDYLKSDKIDCGILVTPVHDNQIKEQHLFFESLYAYIGKNHEYNSKPFLKAEDLRNDDLWLLSQGNCFRNQIINLCKSSDTNGNSNMKYESNSLSTIMKLIDAEGGYTILPQLAVNELNPNNVKQLKKIDNGKYVREVGIVYLRDFYKKSAIDALTKEIKEIIPKEMKSLNKREIIEWK